MKKTVHLLPIGLNSQVLKKMPMDADVRILPTVADLNALAEAIKSCALSVGVIGPDWPQQDIAAAQEMLLDNAIACVVSADLAPASLAPAIRTALQERAHQHESIFFTQLLNLLPDLVYFKDPNGRFLAGNQALATSFQLETPAMLIGRSDSDFLISSYAAKTLADEQEVIRTGKPILGLTEKADYYDNSSTSWWLTWKAPLRDPTGRVIGTFGFSRDQTKLKTTEIALATEAHLLEVLLTGLPDAVFIKDLNGCFILANHVVAQWLGTTPADLKGRNDFGFYPPDFVAAFRKDEESVIRSGMPVINREETLRAHDGRELFLLTTKLPYRNQMGEIIGVIGMCRNVTLRKEFDKQMMEAQAEIVSLRAEVLETGALRNEVARLTAALAAITNPA